MDKKEKNTDRNIEELKRKAESAKRYGQSLQKEGGGLIHNAEQLQSYLAFIALKERLREHEIQTWAASANATIPSQPPQNLPQIRAYNLAFGTSASTASVSSYYCEVVPFQHIKKVEEQNEIIEVKLNPEEESELIEYLKEFSAEHKDVGDLLNMRTGAWQVLNTDIEAKYMFACHSMREILSKIVSSGASNEKVMKAEWWKFGWGSGVTLRQRLRYLIFGPASAGIDESILETINLAVEKGFDADEKLKKVAHASRKLDKKEVEKAMFAMERTLLNIFRYKKLQETKMRKENGSKEH